MYCILYSIAIAIRFVFVFAWLGWFQGRIRVGILYNIYNIIHNLCETSPKNLAKAALVLTRGLIYHLNESPYVFHLVHGWTRLAVSQTLAAIPLSSFRFFSLSYLFHNQSIPPSPSIASVSSRQRDVRKPPHLPEWDMLKKMKDY